jgi:hypothetical protein
VDATLRAEAVKQVAPIAVAHARLASVIMGELGTRICSSLSPMRVFMMRS